MPTELSTPRFPLTHILVLLLVGAGALALVSAVEQRLEPHKKHALNDQRLEDAKLSLEVLRLRRVEVQAGLDDTKPPKPRWSQFSDAEVNRFRLAALAERYELDRRIAELGIREQRLGQTIAAQPRSWPDPLADALVGEGTYAHTIYSVGALGVILLGYLAIAAAAVAGLGSLIGITIHDLGDFLKKVISPVGSGVLVAAMAGATVAAAATGILPDVTPSIDTASSAPIDSPDQTVVDPRPSAPSPRVSILSPVDVTVLGPANYFEVVSPAVGLGEVVNALRDISRIKPQITVQPNLELANAVKELRADITTLNQDITLFKTMVENHVNLIHAEAEATRNAVAVFVTSQVDSQKTLHTHHETLLPVISKGADASRALEPLVRAVVTNTACEVEWQQSLQRRNGFKRLGHLLVGFRDAPCKPDATPRPNVSGVTQTELPR